MGDVIGLEVVTTLDSNSDRVLAAAEGQLESVVIIGYDKDGDEYFASSIADGGSCLWLIERFKTMLLAQGDADQG